MILAILTFLMTIFTFIPLTSKATQTKDINFDDDDGFSIGLGFDDDGNNNSDDSCDDDNGDDDDEDDDDDDDDDEDDNENDIYEGRSIEEILVFDYDDYDEAKHIAQR